MITKEDGEEKKMIPEAKGHMSKGRRHHSKGLL